MRTMIDYGVLVQAIQDWRASQPQAATAQEDLPANPDDPYDADSEAELLEDSSALVADDGDSLAPDAAHDEGAPEPDASAEAYDEGSPEPYASTDNSGAMHVAGDDESPTEAFADQPMEDEPTPADETQPVEDDDDPANDAADQLAEDSIESDDDEYREP